MVELGSIVVNQGTTSVEIDIEGVIGIPERWQFDSPELRVSTYDKFKKSISEIKNIKSKEVVVNIRSLGGNVNDALLIYDTLLSLNTNITTHCYGYVASAATIIAQAASKGGRYISDNSLYLVHKSSLYTGGNENALSKEIQKLQKTDERVANIYAKRSGKEISAFVELMGENNGEGKWLSPSEVVEAGLADATTEGTALTNISKETFAVLNISEMPEIPENKTNKEETMKVKDAWTAILNFFGFDKERDNELTESQLEMLNNEMESRGEQITNLTSQNEELVSKTEALESSHKEALKAKEGEVSDLQSKVSQLQAEVDKLKALPTETEAKEDPSPQGVSRNERQEAYEEDVKAIKG